MDVTRIDSSREEISDVDRITIELEGIKYTFTEEFGDLKIHVHGSKALVSPCCANEITVKGIE